jgi:hypothetical protein
MCIICILTCFVQKTDYDGLHFMQTKLHEYEPLLKAANSFAENHNIGDLISFTQDKSDERWQLGIWSSSKKQARVTKDKKFKLSANQINELKDIIYNDLNNHFPNVGFKNLPLQKLQRGEPYISDLTLLYGGTTKQTVHADFPSKNTNHPMYVNARFKPGSMLYALGCDCRLHFDTKKGTDEKQRDHSKENTDDQGRALIDSPTLTWKKIHPGMAVYFVGKKIHAGASYRHDENGAVRLHLHIDVKGIKRPENELETYVSLER